MQNLNMNLALSETLTTGAEIKYLLTLLCGEGLHQFDLSSADVEVANALNGEAVILGLASYFFL